MLDDSILRSPRFFYVPVLAIEPTPGGSNKYSIIDFRAAFLTDETATTTSIKGSHTGTTDNGVWVQGQDIKQIKVVFFNDDALPIDGRHPGHRLPRHRQPRHPPHRLSAVQRPGPPSDLQG